MANYDTVKAGIANLLKSLGYIESESIVDFKEVSTNEYGNTFILKCLSGEQSDETLNDGLYDNQKWQAQIAIGRSAQSDLANYDDVHRRKDAILKALDKPTNWTGYVRYQKYTSWNIAEFKNYFVLTVELLIQDTYTY